MKKQIAEDCGCNFSRVATEILRNLHYSSFCCAVVQCS